MVLFSANLQATKVSESVNMLLRFTVKVMQAMGNRFVALSAIALLYDQTCTSLDIMKFSKHSVPKHPVTIIKQMILA
jgi:hypothetical protein